MIVTKKAMSRRTVLRGLGTALSLPLLDAMVPALLSIVQPGDVVITLGAGSIGSLARTLLAALSMLFAAGIVLYFVVRHIAPQWPPPGAPEL